MLKRIARKKSASKMSTEEVGLRSWNIMKSIFRKADTLISLSLSLSLSLFIPPLWVFEYKLQWYMYMHFGQGAATEGRFEFLRLLDIGREFMASEIHF